MITCFDVLFQLSNFRSLNFRSKNATKLKREKSVQVTSSFSFIVTVVGHESRKTVLLQRLVRHSISIRSAEMHVSN